MSLVKYGTGKITDQVKVGTDEKGKKKLASSPIKPKEKSDGE